MSPTRQEADPRVAGAEGVAAGHPDHHPSVQRLKRIRGQIDGIIRMIENRRYCPDILTQTAAVKSAIKAVELEVLERHIRHCVRHAFAAGEQTDEQINELNRILKRFVS